MFKQGDVIIKRNVEDSEIKFYEVVSLSQPYPSARIEVACTRVDDPRPDGAKELYYFNLEDVMLFRTREELNEAAAKSLVLPTNPVINDTENDMVKHPSHYTAGGIETREFIKAKLNAMPHLTPWQAYCIGTAMKYPTRAGLKDIAKFKEDLKKAITYLEWAIEDEA